METAESLPRSAGYSDCGQTSSLLVSPAVRTDAWGCVPGMSAAALMSCYWSDKSKSFERPVVSFMSVE